MRAPPLPHRLIAAAVVVALFATGCTRAKQPSASASPATSTTALATTTTSTTSTTAGPTTTTAKPLPPGMGVGTRGADVQALEQKLADLHYDAGKVDQVFDSATTAAVIAFQKVEGLARTGRATDDVVAALAKATDPAPLVAGGGANRVEIDLKRQVLFLYKGGSLLRILMISTGSGKRYCVDGQCDMAVTPGGSFRVSRKISGLRVSRLGQLWNPLYFNGGIAIHGAASVPTYPASHGCVRIPMSASPWFYSTVSTGTPVYVVGGPKAPVPFNEQAPTDNGSTTTTSPSSTSTPTSTPTSTTSPPTTTTSTSTPPPSTTTTGVPTPTTP